MNHSKSLSSELFLQNENSLPVPELAPRLLLIREATTFWREVFKGTLCGTEYFSDIIQTEYKDEYQKKTDLLSFEVDSGILSEISNLAEQNSIIKNDATFIFAIVLAALESLTFETVDMSSGTVSVPEPGEQLEAFKKRVLPVGGFNGMGKNLILFPWEGISGGSFGSRVIRNKHILEKILAYRFYPIRHLMEIFPVDEGSLFQLVLLQQLQENSDLVFNLPYEKMKYGISIAVFAADNRMRLTYTTYYEPRVIEKIHNRLLTVIIKGLTQSSSLKLCKSSRLGTFSDGDLVEEIGDIFRSVLQKEQLDEDANFFQMGGTSITSAQVELELEKRGYGEVDLFTNYTVRKVVGYLEQKGYTTGRAVITDSLSTCTEKSESNTVLNPFNDFFYRGCFYNSLFSLLQSNGRSIVPVLLNDSFSIISCVDNLIGYKPHYEDKKALNDVLAKQGIEVATLKSVEDILSHAITFLDVNKYLIVFIDTFYENIRADKFKLAHDPHTLLLCSYRATTKKFVIIEHERWDQLNYDVRELDEKILVQCYKGYLEFLNEDPFTIYNFFVDDKENDISFKQLRSDYEEYLQMEKTNYYNSAEQLSELAHLFFDISRLDLGCNKNFIQIIEFFSALINSRNKLRYLVNAFCSDRQEILDSITGLIRKWNSVRKHFYRMQILGTANEQTGERIASDLLVLSAMERNFFDCIYNR